MSLEFCFCVLWMKSKPFLQWQIKFGMKIDQYQGNIRILNISGTSITEWWYYPCPASSTLCQSRDSGCLLYFRLFWKPACSSGWDCPCEYLPIFCCPNLRNSLWELGSLCWKWKLDFRFTESFGCFFKYIIQPGFILIEKQKRTQEASLFEAPDTRVFWDKMHRPRL